MRGVVGIWAAATGKERLWVHWANGVAPLEAIRDVLGVATRVGDPEALAALLGGDDRALRIGAAVIIAEISCPGSWPAAVRGLEAEGSEDLLLGCVVGAASKAVDVNELGRQVGRWVAGQDPF